MDLKKIDTIAAAEAGIDYTFLDFDNEPTDWVISVVGVGSRVYKEAVKPLEAYVEKCKREGKSPNEERETELTVKMLVACTTGWKGLTDDGVDVVFSKDEAKRVYLAYPAAAVQVARAIYDIKEMLAKNA